MIPIIDQLNQMEWDLSVLFKSLDDPEIKRSIETAKSRATQIVQEYKGKINSPDMTASKLIELLNAEEKLFQDSSQVGQYAGLTVAADQTNKEALALLNFVTSEMTEIGKQLSFIDIEIGELIEKRGIDFLKEPALHEKKHYLEKIYRRQPYNLSEIEETLILEKNLYGVNEWQKLQAQWLGTRKFKVKVKDEVKEVSWSTGKGLFSDPSREVRREAITQIFGGLGKDAELFATALRNVCGNHVTESKRRGYASLMESSLESSNLQQEMIDAMYNTVESNVGLFQEFLLLKAKLLGTEKLKGEDLNAPMPFQDDREISWDEAKEMIQQGYQEFDPKFGEIAADMFKNNRIDAKARDGKRAGAFCSSWYNGNSAFILQSFNGKMEDVGTLAHEMGHAVHGYLAINAQSLFNVHAGMALAETASEFGSMIFADKFISEATNDDIKKSIIFRLVERLFTVVFEVASRARIESKLYQAIENNEYLNADKINSLFWEGRKLYFGEAIDWMPEQVYEWCWKPHYYRAGLRYYNYPYVFGELLVLSLYNKYKEEGKPFIPKFKEFLKQGGSKSPQELGKAFGVDFTSEEFWKMGIKEIERLLEEFKSLL